MPRSLLALGRGTRPACSYCSSTGELMQAVLQSHGCQYSGKLWRATGLYTQVCRMVELAAVYAVLGYGRFRCQGQLKSPSRTLRKGVLWFRVRLSHPVREVRQVTRYSVVADWGKLPSGWSYYEATSVAVDSQDRVYVFNRGEHPVIVFDHEGNFIGSWGEGEFQRPHGIWIDQEDHLYLSDDQDHTVKKFTAEGTHLMTLGESGKPSDTGCDSTDYRQIQRPGGPFNQPTNVATARDGTIFVSDGYGNCCVHKYTPQGEHLLSWGTPGSGPGEFYLPHGIAVDRQDRVFVADRENSRLQIFSAAGEFLDEWSDVVRPTQVYFDQDDNLYVSELGKRSGLYPWMEADLSETGGRVSVFSIEGQLLDRFGGGEDPMQAGDFYTPHDIWVDSQGSIYVAEVTMSGGGKRGLISPDCVSLQKFVGTG